MIRPATSADVAEIHTLIVELAIYEREPDAVVATVEQIEENLFGADPVAYCHVAEIDGQVVGIAIWFLNYSTWLGKAGLYLEDLFVKPEFRSRGLGLQLMKALAQILYKAKVFVFLRDVAYLPRWLNWQDGGQAYSRSRV